MTSNSSKNRSGIVAWLFGKQITVKELLRKNQRVLNRSIRDLDRERIHMETQEKKIITDIKKMAKEGQMDTVRILAKDLVRTRRYVHRFMLMKANLEAVGIKIRSVQSQQAISEAMLGVTIALRSMNRQFRMPQLQRILQEFEKQSMIMGLKEEVMTDSIEETICEEEEETESDTIVTQILDELGLQLSDQLSELPQTKSRFQDSNAKVSVASPARNTNEHSIDADLQARLNNLRRDDNDMGFPSVPSNKPKK